MAPRPMSLAALAKALLGGRALPKPPARDPFELILLENVAYLASAEKRLEALALLRETIGTTPERILGASKPRLLAVTRKGILADLFADKLVRCARIARDEFGGDLDRVVRLPLAAAKRALRKFPGIGEPGAEKILLFTGRQKLLAPESNGLRVLVRTGIAAEQGSYARTYAAARAATAAFAHTLTPARLAALHVALHRHGAETCRNTAPRCGSCVLARGCPSAAP